jgi:membrane-associated HD superfamily phosphohydrolase
MNFIFQFDQNWYFIFFTFLVSWLILLIRRKSYKDKKEVKKQICLAFIGLFILLLLEIFAVTMNLWHYFPNDWPIILWPTYFVAILFGYQLLKFVEEVTVKF